MNNWLSFSARIYRSLLGLYPSRFRAEYEAEMARTFRDSCRAEYRQNGALGLAGVWAETVPDLVVSVTDEHAQEEFQMVKTNLIRVLAVAGIVGGALWVAFGIMANMLPAGVDGGAFRDVDGLIPLLGMAWMLLTLGLIGLYLRYSERWPMVAKLSLIVGILSGTEVFVCFLFNIGWPVWVFGWFGLIGGLLLSGLALLTLPAERSWAGMLILIALSLFFFNFEDWRVLFGAGAGILMIALSARLLAGSLNRQNEPPLAA